MKVSNVTVRRRLFMVLIFGVIAFAALGARLGYVQLWQGSELAAKAENSWRRDIPYMAKRGEIWDRNGVKLTYNVTSPTIWAIPAQIKDKRATADALAPLLDMTADELYGKINTKNQCSSSFVPAAAK